MSLDPRSEEKLLGVRPELVKVIREAATRTKFRVTEGLRTPERQRLLVAQKKSKTLNSRHITGHAIDFIAIGEDGIATYDMDDMARIVSVIKECAGEQGTKIECGYDWGWDAPHVELDRKAYPANAVGATQRAVETLKDPKIAIPSAVGGVEVVQHTAPPIIDTIKAIQPPDMTWFANWRGFGSSAGEMIAWGSANPVLVVGCTGVIAFFYFLPRIAERLPSWLRSSPSS